MEFVQHDDGSKTPIPDAIIAASDAEPFHLPHHDKKLAEAGVKTLHHRRKGVEAYLAASPAAREDLLKAAEAKLAPKPAEPQHAAEPTPIAGAETE